MNTQYSFHRQLMQKNACLLNAAVKRNGVIKPVGRAFPGRYHYQLCISTTRVILAVREANS